MPMGTKDRRVDAYIENANPFARPILERLRKWAHRHCPECEETLKWSAPHFSYKGKMYCGMSAFKEHCAFGFWHPMMRRNDNSLEGMGSFGKIRSLADLPAENEFARMAAEAMKLTDENVKAPPSCYSRAPPSRRPARRSARAGLSAPSAIRTGRSTSRGSRRRSATRRGTRASGRRSNGWRRESTATGSTTANRA